MSNKYLDKVLEKQAGLSEFFDDITGSRVRKNKSMMDALSEAQAAGKEFKDYAGQHAHLRNASINARIKAGLGVASIAGVGLYGLHKYKQNQQNKILEEYKAFYKQASFGDLARSAGRALNNGVSSFIGQANVASGGQINTFAENLGIKMTGKAGRKFKSGAITQQARDMVRAARKQARAAGMSKSEQILTRKATMNSARSLLKDQLDARMGLLGKGGAVAGTFAIGKHYGTKQAPIDQNQYY
jgi:hypothetical protein